MSSSSSSSMPGSSLVDKFKKLDMYRRVPSDFVKSTYSGAMLSMISSIIMLLLFLNELSSYLQVKTHSHMFIDVNRGGDKLPINIDIELTNLPCSILSLDLQDAMGSHSVNLEGSLMKYRVDSNGKELNAEPYKSVKLDTHENDSHGHDHFAQPDYQMVKQQLADREGCRIKGYFLVNKVPGNFHFSSHAFGPTIQRLATEGLLTMDLSHKINHLSFGNISLLYIPASRTMLFVSFSQPTYISPVPNSAPSMLKLFTSRCAAAFGADKRPVRCAAPVALPPKSRILKFIRSKIVAISTFFR